MRVALLVVFITGCNLGVAGDVTPVDAGGQPVDGGALDAGVEVDGGPHDSGVDSGIDAGVVLSDDGGSPFPLGWSQLPNTKFSDACAGIDQFFGFGADCRNVIYAWSGGIADTKRNRLIIWGGGHNDYYGNEVYALDLKTKVLSRLNDPTHLSSPTACISTLPDGKPTSRHTYGGLTYLPDTDQMVVFGGVVSCPAGGFGSDVWTLSLQGLEATPQAASIWHQVVTTLPNLKYGGILGVSDYDPISKVALLVTAGAQLYSFDGATGVVKLLKDESYEGYHYTGVLEPKRREFFMIGGGFARLWALSTDTPSVGDLTAQLTGCAELIAADYPGLAYDEDWKSIIGWAGGAQVYLVDLAAKHCTPISVMGQAPGAPVGNGTNGRFRYFPSLKSFVLVNDPNQNAYVLNLGGH